MKKIINKIYSLLKKLRLIMRTITFTNKTKSKLALEILFKALTALDEKYSDIISDKLTITSFENDIITISKDDETETSYFIKVLSNNETEKQYQVEWEFYHGIDILCKGNSRIKKEN